MLIRKLKEWWSGLFGPKPQEHQMGAMTFDYSWASEPFFTEHRAKTLRLSEIARERSALKDRLQKAIRDKKARAPIYQALQALRTEELAIERGQ